jgi:hypothetical protein
LCDNEGMSARLLQERIATLAAPLVASWVALLALGGCATQHQTAQALTIAGAAAVIVGASMASDSDCQDPGEGAVEVYCGPRLSKAGRNVGKGVAVAGVGLAAAGYALQPKGPDRMRGPRSDPSGEPPSPYRLIRRDPPPEPVAPEAAASEAAAPEATPPEPNASEGPATCRPEGSAGRAGEPPCSPASAPETPVPAAPPP